MSKLFKLQWISVINGNCLFGSRWKKNETKGITKQEVEHILKRPSYVKKSFENRKEAVGEIKNRTIKVKFVETKNYIKIITII